MNAEQRRKSLTWGKRIILTVVFACAIVYGVLSLAEKQRDPMRLGLEDYIEKITGQDAQITELSKLTLVPRTAFGMQNVILKERGKDRTLIHADEAYISVPFSGMLLGRTVFYALQAKNVEIASGYGLPKKTTFGFAGISDPDPSGPQPSFMVEGSYNGKPLLITAGMERHAGNTFYSYSFPLEYPVTFKIASIEGDGILERGTDDGKLKKVQMVLGDHKIDFVLRHLRGADPAEAEGSIDGAEFTGRQSTKDGRTVFLVSSRTADAKDAAKIKDFLKILNKDLGYGEKEPFFVADAPDATI